MFIMNIEIVNILKNEGCVTEQEKSIFQSKSRPASHAYNMPHTLRIQI